MKHGVDETFKKTKNFVLTDNFIIDHKFGFLELPPIFHQFSSNFAVIF